jgi:hypothetical protein
MNSLEERRSYKDQEDVFLKVLAKKRAKNAISHPNKF